LLLVWAVLTKPRQFIDAKRFRIFFLIATD
jgi:hypothetical protein